MKINEKNLCMFASSPPVDLEGWLNKRGEVNKSWQRRYFILKGNLLFYFDKKGEKEPLGVIILEGCTIELAEDGEQYCFQIVFHGMNNRIYFLSAETQELMEQWMKALTCAGYEYMKLMVSELQRQLDEIEGTKLPTPNNTPVAPKPPPRRQNPFNRPAPAPPKNPPPIVSPVETARSAVSTNPFGGSSVTSSTTSSSSSSSILPSSAAAATSPQQQQIKLSAEELLFRRMHDAFGQEILQTMNERKDEKMLSETPLIEL